MHIPDGYLGPQTYAVLDAAIVPIWAIAASKVRRTLSTRQVPLMALGAAFSFVIMMFNVPVLGGSTGHAVGATLIAILLGPWAACISISIALVIQALVFGDGGITAIGANCINMAVVMPFVGYYFYRLVCGASPSRTRKIVAAGIAAYVAIVVAAVVAGIEFGIQPLLAHTASGQPLYAPYPLSVAVPAMALEHALFFGPVEAFATMGVVAALGRQDSALLDMRPASKPLTWLWASLGVLVLLTPIGVLASGTAWGEWSPAQLKSALGFVPAGLQRLGSAWTTALPGYAPAFVHDRLVGYLVAAVIGVCAVVAVTWTVARLLARRKRDDASAAPRSRVAPTRADSRDGSAPPDRRRRRALARRTADAIARSIAEVLSNERIASAPGLMQGLDPRTKLASILLFAVTVSLTQSIVVLGALVLVTMALAAASGVGVGSFARKVWSSAAFFGVLLAAPAATAWISPGPVLVPLGPLTITATGLYVAARLVARVAAGAGFGLLVILTTRWSDILQALTAWRLSPVVVATLAMAQQQIMSLLRTTENIHLARESRMLSLGTTPGDRGWVVGRIAFVANKSLKAADDVYDAMLSRGFDGTMRTLRRLETSPRDWLWLSASFVGCIVALGLDRLVLPR